MVRLCKAWCNNTFRRHKIDAMIEEFHVEHKTDSWQAQAKFDMPGIDILTTMMVQAFHAAKGVNDVDFSVLDKSSLEVYTLSIQRQNGVKPADVNRVLQEALVQIVELNMISSRPHSRARSALIRCGYLQEDGTLATLS